MEAFLAGDALAAKWLGERIDDDRALAHWAKNFLSAGTWDRAALAKILIDSAKSTDGSPQTIANIALLERADTAAIVAGQQPAVGGGPLYTLVKAAQAVALARRMRNAGQACVPVFWCASEDHDLDEAGHADLVLKNGEIRRVSVDLDGTSPHASLRFKKARSWWAELERQCAEAIGQGSDFIAQIAPNENEGMGAWLCRLMHRLFAADGLIAVEGHQLRPLWRDRLPSIVAKWPRVALENRRQELLAAGYTDAFGELAKAPLFIDRPDGRVALGDADLAKISSDSSPGAALRPILQQAALPAVAAILGPGELHYHAFIVPVYEAAGVQRPLFVPRSSVTLVPTAVARGLQRWNLSPDQVRADTEPPMVELHDDPLHSTLTELQRAIESLERSASALPEDLRRRVEAGTTRLRHDHERLRDSIERGERQKSERPAFGPLKAQLFPRGMPQDRVLSIFQALWQNGPELAPRLVEALATVKPGNRVALI